MTLGVWITLIISIAVVVVTLIISVCNIIDNYLYRRAEKERFSPKGITTELSRLQDQANELYERYIYLEKEIKKIKK